MANNITIANDFDLKQIVYLVHDIEQFPRMVTAINITIDGILYELISGIEVSTHYAFEMSKEKTIY